MSKTESQTRPNRLSRRRAASLALLVYLAICLAVMVSRQAAQIATSHTHNPYLFTAHFTAEGYRALDDPFKPRLFAYLLAAPFIETDQAPSRADSAGRISGPAFERLVERWSFVWFLAVMLLLIIGTKRPLLYMFGTAVGVSFAYFLQGMVYPYDLPSLFFATLAFVLVRTRYTSWLPLALAFGVGFKETLAVFSILPFFVGDGPRKERLRAVGICLVACFWVVMAIDLYSGRSPLGFEAITAADDVQDADRWKLWLNLDIALDPSSLLVFVNAGLALPLLLLPAAGDRLAQGFRWVGVIFVAGLFSLARVDEFRIWFEILPLCIYSIASFLDREDRRPLPPSEASRNRDPDGTAAESVKAQNGPTNEGSGTSIS